jgi:hypothetical protein
LSTICRRAELPVAPPDQALDFLEVPPALQLPVERNRRLLAVAADAEVGAGVFDDTFREDGKPDAAEHDRGIAQGADALHELCQIRHEPLPARPEAVVDVAKGQADERRAAAGEVLAQGRFRLLAQRQVQNAYLEARAGRRLRHVLQPERPNRRHHAIRIHERQHDGYGTGVTHPIQARSAESW